jgi:hypothetical protein
MPPEREVPANARTDSVIRYATADDVPALRRLVQETRTRAFCGPALVAEVGGTVGAALSLVDGTVIAHPSQTPSRLTHLLRRHRDALLAPS